MSASELLSKPPLHGNGLSVSSLRIVLVSGELLYREGMRLAFRQAQSLVLLDGITMADAIEAAKRQLADLVMIDANNLAQAIEKAKVLVSCSPEIPVVALTATASSEEVGSAFELGMRGCILKRVEAAELIRILESIGQGSLYVPPELGAGVLRQRVQHLNGETQREIRRPNLTAREAQVLGYAARGLTNKEIARELIISEKTVKHYMTVIMEKLQARNRVDAALRFRLR
jgi:two-component system, NarL family, nitrate/nitrite response regulator NarL